MRHEQFAYAHRPTTDRSAKRLLVTMQAWLPVSLALLMLLLPSANARAQFETASVLGYVRDVSGAAIPNAAVTLTNNATAIAQAATTDTEGRYEFSSVKIGNYHSRCAEAQASRRRRRRPLTYHQRSAESRCDIEGGVGQRDGDRLRRTHATGDGDQLARAGDWRRVKWRIFRLMGDPMPISFCWPRAYAGPSSKTRRASSREAFFNVNGQRSAFNNFLLDGLDNNNYGTSNQGFANENIPPSPDAVSEFRVETNNYSAEYGRASGAVINVSTRRGTNQFHGKAYDYLRNTDLNAIGPFQPAGGIKQTFIRNQFGGTFGGPIYKDHTFFFLDYEGLRQIFRNQVTTVTLPNAEQRQGIFLLHYKDGTTAPITLRNPITGTRLYIRQRLRRGDTFRKGCSRRTTRQQLRIFNRRSARRGRL